MKGRLSQSDYRFASPVSGTADTGSAARIFLASEVKVGPTRHTSLLDKVFVIIVAITFLSQKGKRAIPRCHTVVAPQSIHFVGFMQPRQSRLLGTPLLLAITLHNRTRTTPVDTNRSSNIALRTAQNDRWQVEKILATEAIRRKEDPTPQEAAEATLENIVRTIEVWQQRRLAPWLC